MAIEDRIRDWDGRGVVVRHHRATGAWMFVALHDDTLGPPTGGTRMRVYPSPEDGLTDAQRLARGMTAKWASIGLPFGGGKAVLALPAAIDGEARRDLLLGYAELLESLAGAFRTGEDLGTTPADMAFLGRHSRWVHGVVEGAAEARDPGPYTARGVIAAIRAAVEARFGDRSLAGRTVVVQGVGDVGAPLARRLAAEGARVRVADVDRDRAAGLAAELDTTPLDPARAHASPCDVFAPCAVGQVLDERTVPELACAVVAGSANNQLADPVIADRLLERGIVYAPDFVANAGGALAFGTMNLGIEDEDEIGRRLDRLEHTMAEILKEAGDRGESPDRAARRRVERALKKGSSLRFTGRSETSGET